MSQIFPRQANALARSSIAIVLTLVAIGGWLVFTLMRSSWATKQNEFVEQPIQFSHAHHVGGVGLDCRLLSYVGGEICVRRNSADQDVHELSCESVDDGPDSGARPGELSQ